MKENYLRTAEVRDRALAMRRTGLSDLIRISDAAPGIFPAAGGVSAAFSDGADGRPLRVLKAKVTADQAGTGDPSAGNIRPISGRTGAVIRRCSLYDPAEVTMGVKLNLASVHWYTELNLGVWGEVEKNSFIALLVNPKGN